MSDPVNIVDSVTPSLGARVTSDGELKVNISSGVLAVVTEVAAPTSAGVTSVEANPIQGVDGGVPVPVSGTVTANIGSIPAIGGSVDVLNFPSVQNVAGTLGVSGGSINLVDGVYPSRKLAVNADGTIGVSIVSGLSGGIELIDNTVSSTPAGTTATAANPIQGVTGGVPVNVAIVSGGSGGGGSSNTVAPTNAGTTATTANPVQGVTGGVPMSVSGTVSVSNNLAISNFPTVQAVSGNVNAAISGTINVGNFPSSQSITGVVATSITGTPNVAVTNYPALQNVSGNVNVGNFPAIQNVSGTINAAIIGGNTAAVKVDGSAVTQPISGLVTASITGTPNVAITNFPSIQSVSGNVNATVSGGVTVSNFPATQAVSGLVNASITGVPNVALNVGGTALSNANPAPVAIISGGGASNTVAATSAGTTATTANPIQGVTGGVAVPISGTVSIGNNVSIANFPTTQAVSGLVNASITGTPNVNISNFPSVQNVSGSINATLSTLPALVASSAAIGQVGAKTGGVEVTPTISTSAYTLGYIVGGVITFSSALLAAGTGILQSILIRCKSVQTSGFKLYLFKSNPTNSTWTDRTAPAISNSDLPALIGVYPLSSPDTGLNGTATIWESDGIGKALVIGATTMYGILVTTGTPTFSSTSDLTIALGILQD